jgi:hypothetical protein
MPEQAATARERLRASIQRNYNHIRKLQSLSREMLCDVHETVLRTREAISQSLDAIAKADEVLARSYSGDGENRKKTTPRRSLMAPSPEPRGPGLTNLVVA